MSRRLARRWSLALTACSTWRQVLVPGDDPRGLGSAIGECHVMLVGGTGDDPTCTVRSEAPACASRASMAATPTLQQNMTRAEGEMARGEEQGRERRGGGDLGRRAAGGRGVPPARGPLGAALHLRPWPRPLLPHRSAPGLMAAGADRLPPSAPAHARSAKAAASSAEHATAPGAANSGGAGADAGGGGAGDVARAGERGWEMVGRRDEQVKP